MPDITALDMPLDTTGKLRPAVSATQDLPKHIESVKEAVVEIKTEPEKLVETAKTEPEKPLETKVETKSEEEDAEAVLKKDETPPWMKALISKEKNKRRAAADRATQAEAREAEANKRATDALEALKAATAAKPEPIKEEPRPKRDAFADPDTYDAALEAWSSKKATAEAKATTEREFKDAQTAKETKDRETRETAVAKQIAADWSAKLDKAREKYPDYDDVAQADDVPISVPMAHAILNDENGTDIAYYLGQHKDEAARIAKLNPMQQALAIGRLAAVIVEKPKPVSRAATPITPLGSTNSAVVKGDEELSMDEYARKHTPRIVGSRKPFISSTATRQ